MKKMIGNRRLAAVAAAALSLSLLAGCGAPSAPAASASGEAAPALNQEHAGTVLLSVNPEIEVRYDERGLVVEVEGVNEDGRRVASAYADFDGKTCEQVINELVTDIYEAGYFDQTVGGNARNVVIKLEEGSAYPGEDFLNTVAESVRQAVAQCGVKSKPVTVDRDDLGEDGRIKPEKVKEMALRQLGLETASFVEREYDLDDNVYELELTAFGVDYELEVDAVTGKIREADVEANDDWKKLSEKPARKAERISLEEAKQIALKKAGVKNAVFDDREYDADDGVYELEFTAGGVEYEFEVDAATGAIREMEADRDDDHWDDDDDDRAPASVKVSPEEAKQIALKKVDVKNAVVTEREYDDDGVYELEVVAGGVEHEFEVDAATGAIREMEADRDDDDDDRWDDDDDDDRRDDDDDDDRRDDDDDDDRWDDDDDDDD